MAALRAYGKIIQGNTQKIFLLLQPKESVRNDASMKDSSPSFTLYEGVVRQAEGSQSTSYLILL